MRRAFLSVMLAAFVISSAAKAAIVEEFKVADWDGIAFTSDETGAFSHCSVYALYQNGSTLYISSEATGAWFLSVANDSWALTEGGQFAIRFRIDRRESVEGTSTALGTTQLGLPIEADNPFVGQLRRGNTLTMTFQNTDYAFELSNSSRAMDAAQDCVRRHLQAGTRSPVMSQQGQQPEAPPLEATTGQPMPPPEPESVEQSGDRPATASGEQQTFGSWVVTATDDGAGTFVNCTAYGMHGDDQLILSYFSDDTWTFGLYRAAWKLDTNATYYLWYNVDAPADGAGVVKHPAEAVEATRVFFEISEVEDIIERMEAGKTLNVQLRGLTGAPESYSYPLDQTSEAFEATRQCVAEHVAPAETADGTSKDGTGAKGEDTASADTEAEEPAPEPAASGERRELPTLGPTVVEELQVPGWKAAAFSDEAGALTHCAIKAEYQNGATLGVARAVGGDLVLAVQHTDWALTEGAWVPLTYTVTGSGAAATEGQAVLVNVIMANVGADATLTQAVHDAKEMSIEAEGKTLSFDISDIGPGIEAIDACVARLGATPEPEPEVAPAPAAKKAGVDPAPAEPEAETDVASAEPSGQDAIDMRALEESFLTMGALMRAGFVGFEELADDAVIPVELPEGKTAWTLDGVTGVTLAIESGGPDDVKSSVSGAELDNCGGMLKTSIVTSDNAGHMHFSLRCSTGGGVKILHYVVLPRDGGGSYVIAMLGKDDGTDAEAIAKKVYEASLES